MYMDTISQLVSAQIKLCNAFVKSDDYRPPDWQCPYDMEKSIPCFQEHDGEEG